MFGTVSSSGEPVNLATVVSDRITKYAATTHLADQPWRFYLGDLVRIGYAENTGGLLGLGAGLPPGARTAVFVVGTGLVLLGLAFLTIRRHWSGLSLLGMAVFIAGGASNWIDRVLQGFVVDFVQIGLGPVRTGVFNVADVAIFLGIGPAPPPSGRGAPARAGSPRGARRATARPGLTRRTAAPHVEQPRKVSDRLAHGSSATSLPFQT